MVTDRRSWCVICGEPKGGCIHIAGHTKNINEAYRTWLKTKREQCRKFDEILKGK